MDGVPRSQVQPQGKRRQMKRIYFASLTAKKELNHTAQQSAHHPLQTTLANLQATLPTYRSFFIEPTIQPSKQAIEPTIMLLSYRTTLPNLTSRTAKLVTPRPINPNTQASYPSD